MKHDAIEKSPSKGANNERLGELRTGTNAGPQILTERAGLEQLLAAGGQVENPGAVAAELLNRFGGLNAVLVSAHDRLLVVDGISSEAVRLLKLVDWIKNQTEQIRGEKADVPEPSNLQSQEANKGRPESHEVALPIRTPRTQPELRLPMAGQTDLQLTQNGSQPAHAGERKTIQDVLLPEGLLAVKLSTGAKSPVKLQELLVTRLGQNSMETRRRYAQSILKWFFPDGIDGILSKTWRAYQDEAIISDFLRWSYLTQETVMGRCVAEALFPLENGLR
jgi:hypothetical protein